MEGVTKNGSLTHAKSYSPSIEARKAHDQEYPITPLSAPVFSGESPG